VCIIIVMDAVETLRRMAAKYIWWKTPDEAMRYPRRVITQVMNIGDYSDVQTLVHALGDDALKDALAAAEAGELNEKSWVYWHLRLGLCSTQERCPPLPERRVQ
jgi:predicted amidohydrolase YtcJ